MVKQQITAAIKTFKKNKLLTIINMIAIVLALVIITITSTWMFLKYMPSAPAENAKNFYQLKAEDEKGQWQSVTTDDCDLINKSSLNGYTWFYSERFSLIELNRNNRKQDFKITTSDYNFWRALNFNFLVGKAFTREQFENKEYVAVISEKMAIEYFGHSNVVGESILYGSFSLKVQGVFEPINIMHDFSFDIYIPNSLIPQKTSDVNACYYAINEQGKKELEIFLKKYSQGNKRKLKASSFLKSPFAPGDDYVYLGAMLVAFLLPIISFANLFMRKMELKLPEMALKRAFGATRQKVFLALVIENTFYVALAGVFALFISHPLMGFTFNPSGSGTLSTHFLGMHFYLYTVILFVLFGVFSAIKPAWKVSGKSLISSINK